MTDLTPAPSAGSGQVERSTGRLKRALAIAEVVLLVCGVLGQLFVMWHGLIADDIQRYSSLQWLLHGRLASARYSLVGSLFSIPLALVDSVLQTDRLFVLRYNVCVFAVGALLFAWGVRRRVSASLIRRTLLLLFFASMLPQHLQFYYGEVFTAILAGVGLAFVTLERPVLGWVLVGLAVANTPVLLVPLALVVAWRAREEKRLRHLLAWVATAAVVLLENQLRRGSPTNFGYPENDGIGPKGFLPYSGLPGFSYPLVFGVLSLAFSFGRGVLFYAPGLWLGLSRHTVPLDAPLRRAWQLWWLFLAGMVLIYARWWAWHGATFWGPRFFLFASVPASYAVAQRLEATDESLSQDLLTFAALVASFWIGIDSLIYRLGDVPERTCRMLEGTACLYTPEMSPIFAPFVFPKTLDPSMWLLGGLAAASFFVVALPLVSRIAVHLWGFARTAWHSELQPRLWRW